MMSGSDNGVFRWGTFISRRGWLLRGFGFSAHDALACLRVMVFFAATSHRCDRARHRCGEDFDDGVG